MTPAVAESAGVLRVRAAGPLRGTCRVPGDKSISHRALVIGALSEGEVEIRGLGSGGDNRSTAAALEALGVTVRRAGDRVVVEGRGRGGLRAAAGAIDCGNSGTTMRLLCGVLAGCPFESILCGDASLSQRPMGRLADALRRMGASIEGREAADPARPGLLLPPLRVRGGPLRGIRFESPVASAQLKSAVLLAGLAADGVTEVVEPAASRDHTERMLRAAGAPVAIDPARRIVRLDPAGWNRRLGPGFALDVPGDLSSAAFLLVAAACVPGSDVTVEGVGTNPTRTGVIDVLRNMGADIEIHAAGDAGGEPVGAIRVTAARLRGCDVAGDLALRSIDEIPALAVAAALADGRSSFRDLAELRVKESDRVAALARELRRAGVDVEERADGLLVQGLAGRRPSGGVAVVGGDHRIAMAAAILGLMSDEETVVDSREMGTSFPTFADALRSLGADTAGPGGS